MELPEYCVTEWSIVLVQVEHASFQVFSSIINEEKFVFFSMKFGDFEESIDETLHYPFGKTMQQWRYSNVFIF